ncbi:tetratricopeptide repeat protein [Cupriavidus gilardii]|uniref:Tetratricopeptide repeat protein n=1 Tax=Cupriavidus gilardii TaxID=82541 RepID=A0A6N1BN38_9BURK|nr:tetratricopeptide repeat protein [Cupriavidus gilardii]ALD89556.1 Tetratricopeptide repeats [Cupriavidus gilardii CR3]QQE07194.1 tetratricopeptide repeat protein [Cupriavidus sp. ISTL7]KAB0595121.1 tetratricopeptide repeat protein [Cupriavidus gilardii]MCT9016644.1 tetratricopeptide repeat protein [Cupriavidus gilardii]MCT9056381.1 tetratricopeptide repeat protein [Cupriavidus gilardii]
MPDRLDRIPALLSPHVPLDEPPALTGVSRAAPGRRLLPLLAAAVVGASALTGCASARDARSAQADPARAEAKSDGVEADRPMFTLSSDGELEPTPATPLPPKMPLPELPLTADIMYRVLAAEISMQRGLTGPAYRTYVELARSTRDPRFAQRATEIAFNARVPQQALDGARLWTDLAPTSPAARQVLSTLLVLNARWEEAEPLLSLQLNGVPPSHRPEAILQLQQQLSRTSDPAGAAALLQRLVANDMQSAETRLALARAKETAGDVPGALAELDEAQRLRPDYEAAALMAAELRADSSPEQAIAGLKRFLDKAPASVNGRITLARVYLQRNEMDAARREFEALRKVAPDDPRVPLALGLTGLQARRYDEAERYLHEYLRLAEKAPSSNPDVAYQYLAQIAEERKDYAGAVQWLDRIEDQRMVGAASVKRAQMLGRMGRLDDAQAIFGDMLADAEDIADPDQRAQRMMAVRQAEVGMLMEVKAYDRARKVLDERIKAEPNNAEWLYELAMLDEREKRYDSMERRLRQFIALQPDQKQGYNALGYSLADRNIRLQEALKLLEKATELGPDDPYIMDSLGWVKFRLGQLQPAAKLLRDAYAKAPEAEIAAHLGEVLWQLGERDEARKTWEEGVKLDPNNETLVETLRRYNVRLAQ